MTMQNTDAQVEVFDLGSLRSGAGGYSSAVFDGRFIYLVPLFNGEFFGEVARFDPQKSLDDPSGWKFFDTQVANQSSAGYIGGQFDGRFLYLIPHCNNQFHGLVARFDTTADFNSNASWSFVDTTEWHSDSKGFVAGAFDGRYVYLSPYRTDPDSHSGLITRYDSLQPFFDRDAWEFFDLGKRDPLLRGYHGSIVHQGSVLFVPYAREGRGFHGNLARFLRTDKFTDPGSWDSFDLSSLNPRAKGFVGGVSVGSSIVLAPYFDGDDRSGLITIGTGDESHKLADWDWKFVDSTIFNPLSRGFFGAVANHQDVYFVPHCLDGVEYHGLLAKMQMLGDVSCPSAWSFTDIRKIDSGASGFMGGVLVEGWIYLAPFENGPGKPHGKMARVKVW
ncbi:hypothetical protein OAV24_01870 [Gammaproteobacteria bacterium]|jgi:hypothetical protein|nr:hypothetical protein [Gammaproteobacteria bacterium]